MRLHIVRTQCIAHCASMHGNRLVSQALNSLCARVSSAFFVFFVSREKLDRLPVAHCLPFSLSVMPAETFVPNNKRESNAVMDKKGKSHMKNLMRWKLCRLSIYRFHEHGNSIYTLHLIGPFLCVLCSPGRCHSHCRCVHADYPRSVC